MSLVLGIDTSTTATKAILVDRSGVVKGVASATYGYETPQPLWSEQSPESWWEGTASSIRDVMEATGTSPGDIEAVGLTGQMHGSVLLDGEGAVVRPAILWNDQRTGPQCDEIRRRIGKQRLIEITGNDALTGFTAPKLLWVQEHEPENWARVRHVLLPKDYVRFRLTDGLRGRRRRRVGDDPLRSEVQDMVARGHRCPRDRRRPPSLRSRGTRRHRDSERRRIRSDGTAGRHASRGGRGRPIRQCRRSRGNRTGGGGPLSRDFGRRVSPRPMALPSSRKDGSMPFAMPSPVAGT